MHATLNEEAMTQTVDLSLYRKRSEHDLHSTVSAAPVSDDAGDQGKIADQLKSLGYM
jgi:hypothetical protein